MRVIYTVTHAVHFCIRFYLIHINKYIFNYRYRSLYNTCVEILYTYLLYLCMKTRSLRSTNSYSVTIDTDHSEIFCVQSSERNIQKFQIILHLTFFTPYTLNGNKTPHSVDARRVYIHAVAGVGRCWHER